MILFYLRRSIGSFEILLKHLTWDTLYTRTLYVHRSQPYLPLFPRRGCGMLPPDTVDPLSMWRTSLPHVLLMKVIVRFWRNQIFNRQIEFRSKELGIPSFKTLRQQHPKLYLRLLLSSPKAINMVTDIKLHTVKNRLLS